MTQTIAQRIRTDIESEYRRSHAEQAAAKRDGITILNLSSRSQRTIVWNVRNSVATIRFIRNDGTFKYREVAL